MKKIFIGIDFSKEKFDATLIQAEGLKECAPSEHEVFDNKTSGYRRLVKWVKAQAEDFTADSWLFCGENTGGYSIGLCNYLYGSGYDMWLGKPGTVLDDTFFVGNILPFTDQGVSVDHSIPSDFSQSHWMA